MSEPQNIFFETQRFKLEISRTGGMPCSFCLKDGKGECVELMGSWHSSSGGQSFGFAMFPSIGFISPSGRFIHEGKFYEPGKHGFVRKAKFEIVSQSDKNLTLAFTHDPEKNVGLYPFKAKMELIYVLQDNGFDLGVRITNLDTRQMSYGVGLHPAFMWPLPDVDGREGHFLQFARAFPAGTRIYRPDDAKISKGRMALSPVAADGLWKIAPSQFTQDAYFFLAEDAFAQSLAYGHEQARCRIQFDLENWDGLGIWSKPEAGNDFLCIEPLNGAAVFVEGEDEPELSRINDLAQLPAQETRTNWLRIYITL